MAPRQVDMMKLVLLLSSLATLAVLAWAAFEENVRGEWRTRQQEYRAELIRTADSDAARSSAEDFAVDFKQIYLLVFMRQWQPKRSDVETAVALADGNASEQVASSDIGRTLYKANCVTCHGQDGGGDLGPSINTQAFLRVVPNSYLADTLITGRPGTGMPSWRHLSNEDIASLLLYLRSWQTEPSRDEAWHAQTVPRGDWDAGKFLFAGHCAGCHGVDAEGATGPQLNNREFLRLTSDVMLQEWIRHGKAGTQMRGFRKGEQGVTDLSDGQIEDVVAYLRSLERAGEEDIVRTAKYPNGRHENGVHVYATHCVGCHGEQGQGASGPALANSNFLWFASDGFLLATMAMGRSGTEMRPVKRSPQSILSLSSDEVNDLVALLRRWEFDPPQTGPTNIPHRFVVPWDLARGRELFTSNCAGCHGDDGKGSWVPRAEQRRLPCRSHRRLSAGNHRSRAQGDRDASIRSRGQRADRPALAGYRRHRGVHAVVVQEHAVADDNPG